VIATVTVDRGRRTPLRGSRDAQKPPPLAHRPPLSGALATGWLQERRADSTRQLPEMAASARFELDQPSQSKAYLDNAAGTIAQLGASNRAIDYERDTGRLCAQIDADSASFGS
jgi:hypothetical protein